MTSHDGNATHSLQALRQPRSLAAPQSVGERGHEGYAQQFDPQRNLLGRAGRERIERESSETVLAPRLAGLFREVVAGR